jgi:hypothetical protein
MSSGVRSQAGWIDAASWGASWSTVTTLLTLREESLTREYQKLRSQALLNQAAAHEFEHGHVIVSGNLTWELDYNNLGLLEYALGAEAGGTFTPTVALEKFFHLEVDRGGTYRYRFQSCMVNGVTISGSADSEDPVLVSMEVTAYDVTATATSFPSLSLTSPNRVYFDHIDYFYIGGLGAALDSANELAINSFELSIDNNLDQVADSVSATRTVQPVRDGFRATMLKIGGARYDSDWWYLANAKENGTVATGADFPVAGPGAIQGEAELEWFVNTDNSDMSGVTDEISIVVA